MTARKGKGKNGAKRPAIDWAAVRIDYEAGETTIEQVAQKHGVTVAAVKKRAEREGWKRIKQPDAATFRRSQSKPVIGELIVIPAAKQADAGAQPGVDGDNEPPAPQSAVEAILTHRRAISRARALSEKLIGELELQTKGPALFDMLIDEHFGGGGINGAMTRQMLRSFLETGHRAKVLSYITKSLSELVNLERQAFGLEEKSVKDPIEQHRLAQERTGEAGRSREEIARALLDMIERASRNRQRETMQ